MVLSTPGKLTRAHSHAGWEEVCCYKFSLMTDMGEEKRGRRVVAKRGSAAATEEARADGAGARRRHLAQARRHRRRLRAAVRARWRRVQGGRAREAERAARRRLARAQRLDRRRDLGVLRLRALCMVVVVGSGGGEWGALLAVGGGR